MPSSRPRYDIKKPARRGNRDMASSPGNAMANHASTKAAMVFSKTKLCKFNLAGMCTRGSFCAFAHSEKDLKAAPDLYRTQMCQRMVENGGTCDDANCRFAHSKSELRHVSFKNNRKSEAAPQGRTTFGNFQPVSNIIEAQMMENVMLDGKSTMQPILAAGEYETIAVASKWDLQGNAIEHGQQFWVCPLVPPGDFMSYSGGPHLGWTSQWGDDAPCQTPEETDSSIWSRHTTASVSGCDDQSGDVLLPETENPTPSKRVQVIVKNTFVHALELGAAEEEETITGSMIRSASSPPSTPCRTYLPSPALPPDFNSTPRMIV
jgi:hypothetical protein